MVQSLSLVTVARTIAICLIAIAQANSCINVKARVTGYSIHLLTKGIDQ